MRKICGKFSFERELKKKKNPLEKYYNELFTQNPPSF